MSNITPPAAMVLTRDRFSSSGKRFLFYVRCAIILAGDRIRAAVVGSC